MQFPDDFVDPAVPSQSAIPGADGQMPEAVPVLIDDIPLAPPETGEQDSHVKFRQQMGHVSQHSGVVFAGVIFSVLLSYVFKIYLARHLGAQLLGFYSLGMTMVGSLSIFNGMGLTLAALRFVPVYRATNRPDLLRGFLGRSLARLLLCNIVFAAGLVLLGPFVARQFYHTPELGKYMGLFATLMVIGILTTFLGQVLAGYGQIARRTVLNSFIGPSVTMAIAVGFIAAGMGLRGYLLAQVVVSAAITVALALMVWKYTPHAARQFRRDLPPIESRVFSYALTTLGLGLLEYLISQTDRITLGFYRNPREVGIYSVAVAVVAFVAIILRSINQVFAPMISDLHARQQNELLGRMFQTLTKWITGLTLPLAAAVIINARPILHIFGSEFEVGWPVLIIGTVGQLVNCGVGSAGTILLMAGHQTSLIWIEGISAAVMVILNVLLIPLWGISGAAVAASITVITTNILYLVVAHRKTGLFPYNRSYWNLVLPTLASCGLLVIFHHLPIGRISPMLAIALGLVFSYGLFVGLSMLFGLDDDDKLIVGAIWNRIRMVFPKFGTQ